MRPDMFSGWGIRTLSAEHPAFDPLAYQQGSVWAFDNALIVSGLRRDGEEAAALRVMAATLDAARGFRNGRLLEFIAGTQRLPGNGPVHAPRADPMQAWSAAAVPFIVSELPGLQVDGFPGHWTCGVCCCPTVWTGLTCMMCGWAKPEFR